MLEFGDESLEFEILTQVLEVGIQQEEWPAGKTGVDAAFKPCQRLVPVAKQRMNASDLVVGVMRMAEGARRIERPANTLERRAFLVSPGVQHALKADEQ